MRIGMILPTGFPPDIRVEKEIGTLQGEHDVALLCPNAGGQADTELWNGARIDRVFSRFERGRSSLGLMRNCRSRSWYRAIERFVRASGPDVLHVHDLPLLGTALEVATRHAIPVVSDLHENYPAMLEEGNKLPLRQTASLGKLMSRMAVSIPKWKEYEREAVSQANQVIVVIEEARDRLVNSGIPADRIHVVGNYASQNEIAPRASPEQAIDGKRTPFRVLYAGGFDPTRDLRTVITSVSRLPSGGLPDLQVQLVGGKGRDLAELREHAESLGVADRVVISPWMSLADVERLIATSDVGLVPHVKSPHTDTTIPHKLFQYMYRRLPVIVSDCAPLERIVTETGCGLVYPSGDADALASCIGAVYENRERAAEMGSTGRDAVDSRFNWEAAARILLNVYRAFDSALADWPVGAAQ